MLQRILGGIVVSLMLGIAPAWGATTTIDGGGIERVTTGTITSGSSTVQATPLGNAGARVQITGSWTGTMTIVGSVDCVNTFTMAFLSEANPAGAAITSTTVNGTYDINSSGLCFFNVVGSGITGTASIGIRMSVGAVSYSVGGGGTTLVTAKVMTCTAASANTLACTDAASGSVVCVNNAATQTCTLTGATAFYGFANGSGSTEPAGFTCYNSASSTPAATSQLLAAPSASPLGPAQIMTAPGNGVGAANITCVVAGGTALLNSGGVLVYYR